MLRVDYYKVKDAKKSTPLFFMPSLHYVVKFFQHFCIYSLKPSNELISNTINTTFNDAIVTTLRHKSEILI